MIKNFIFYFALFIVYSFIGWLIEMFVENIINKKFVNRGFLIGPYCPIYGVSSILMILFLNRYHNDIIILFCVSLVICSITEYLTSFILEKIFKVRWWDYTNEPFNVNGRVCLVNSILFGVLGVFLIIFLNPLIADLISKINPIIFYIVFVFILILFILDVIVSFKIVSKIKISIPNLKLDYTKEISTKVKEILDGKSILTKRVVRAFPNIKFNVKNKKT